MVGGIKNLSLSKGVLAEEKNICLESVTGYAAGGDKAPQEKCGEKMHAGNGK